VGYSISEIDPRVTGEAPSTVDALLQGRVSGLTVTGNSGQIGGGASIRLRGNVSATQSNQPLVYMDGVRIKSDELINLWDLGTAYGPSTTLIPRTSSGWRS